MARLKKFNVLKKAEKHNFFRLALVIVCIIMPGKKMYQNIKSEEKNYIIPQFINGFFMFKKYENVKS